MLKKSLILITLLISIAFSAVDFFWFKQDPAMAFIFHNFFAIIIGLSLIYLSFIFSKKKLNSKNLNLIILIAGLAMAIIHLVKLFIGKCI